MDIRPCLLLHGALRKFCPWAMQAQDGQGALLHYQGAGRGVMRRRERARAGRGVMRRRERARAGRGAARPWRGSPPRMMRAARHAAARKGAGGAARGKTLARQPAPHDAGGASCGGAQKRDCPAPRAAGAPAGQGAGFLRTRRRRGAGSSGNGIVRHQGLRGIPEGPHVGPPQLRLRQVLAEQAVRDHVPHARKLPRAVDRLVHLC